MAVELRSDTFTQPSPGMRQAMLNAPLGDDVFGEDPTVNALESRMAAMFGKEAAIFCPSGTMTNQIAIKLHTQPGDEVVCDELSHVYQYEGGGIAFNSLCSTRCLQGDRGRINASQVLASVNADDVHKARTSLVVLENTSNRGGGACYEAKEIEAISKVCSEQKLILHLDGARIWNAIVAKNEDPLWYGRHFSTISVCMSKGMGAPVGSVLIGSTSHIKQARRIRKVFGGGMRQAGLLAAACNYALDHNLQLLHKDHEHAAQVAAIVEQQSWCAGIKPVETNILIFNTQPDLPAQHIADRLRALADIRCIAIAKNSIRMVFHLDVSDEQTDEVCKTVSRVA